MANEHDAAAMAGDVAHGAAQAAGHAAPNAGMPQLDLTSFPNQIFWLLVTLVVIYWVLSRIALPRISAVLADRNGTISGDLAAAEDYKLKAREAEAAYEKALADARAQAQKIVAEACRNPEGSGCGDGHADAEIAARAARSEARIAEIRAGAVEAVRPSPDTASELVTALGGRPMRRRLPRRSMRG